MRFYILRHAESTNNARDIHDVASGERVLASVRDPDPGLSERGLKQAKNAARFFASLPVETQAVCIYTSLMTRTLQTAAPIAEVLACPLVGKPFLHEEGGVFHGERRQKPDARGHQIAHGLSRSGMLRLTPRIELDADIGEQGWWRGGRETAEEVQERAQAVASWMHGVSRGEEEGVGNGPVLLVSHGMFLHKLLCTLFRCLPNGCPAVFLSSNCSLAILDVVDGRVGVCALNFLEHLEPGPDRTGHKCMGMSVDVAAPFDGRCLERQLALKTSSTEASGDAPEKKRRVDGQYT